jgi:hypothetical protein
MVVLAGSALACGGSQKATSRDEPVTIDVLDPGAEPHAMLSYEPQLGVSERVEVQHKLRIGTSLTNTVLENGRSGMDLPTIVSRVRLEARSLAPNGDVTVACEIEDASMLDDVTDAAMRKRVARLLPSLKGARGSWRRSRSGEVHDEKVPSSTNPTVSDSGCSSSRIPFPQVPIGVGARWRARATRTLMGVRWHDDTVYTLRALQGSTASIDFDGTSEAGEQALKVEPRATTTLKQGTGRTAGHAQVSLRRLVATGDLSAVVRTTLLITDHSLSIKAENEAEVITIVKALD